MQIPNYSCVIIFLKQKINTFNDACKCTTFFIYSNKKRKKMTLYASAKKNGSFLRKQSLFVRKRFIFAHKKAENYFNAM